MIYEGGFKLKVFEIASNDQLIFCHRRTSRRYSPGTVLSTNQQLGLWELQAGSILYEYFVTKNLSQIQASVTPAVG